MAREMWVELEEIDSAVGAAKLASRREPVWEPGRFGFKIGLLSFAIFSYRFGERIDVY